MGRYINEIIIPIFSPLGIWTGSEVYKCYNKDWAQQPSSYRTDSLHQEQNEERFVSLLMIDLD